MLNFLKAQKVFDFTVKLMASGCFTGYSKFASGTVGCFFIGIPTYLFIYYLSHRCLNQASLFIEPDLCYSLLVVILTIIGIWVSGRAEIIFAKKDSGKIVIDEVVGYLFSMFALPLNIYFILIGFVLFRIFDVWKPLFIRSLQNLPGGFGVMLDDCAGGILTCIILQIINYILKINWS